MEMPSDSSRVTERDRPDAALVEAARAGDKGAFVEIVARHQAMVCGIAFAIVGDFAASEDVAQEAFLIAWRRFHELREPARLRGWLGQITRNAALGHLRHRRDPAPLENAPLLLDESPTPDEAAATEEEAALVRDELAKLPEMYRLPLVLYYREGQSVRAVAGALEISEDVVKQRLARGREMLRDRMSRLIERVLVRSGPNAGFTMVIAAAIGALTAPATVAGSAFCSSSVATGSLGASAGSAPALTIMSTSKTFIATAALAAAISIPVGYYFGGRQEKRQAQALPKVAKTMETYEQSRPSFENSALFAEWRELHIKHGTTSEAMPILHKAISELNDPFRRRAFGIALVAEWAQVDPQGGLDFFLEKGRDGRQRRQFLEEWLALDAPAAVDALLRKSGWETIARDSLVEIARRIPDRVPEIASRLPKPANDGEVRQAFSVLAEGGLEAARKAAETVSGPNREQALAGVAQVWATTDFEAATAWAKEHPNASDRDEIIRAALTGRAAVDPVAALDRLGTVPPGGNHLYFASTTGARVLREAAAADFDATVGWLAAHPGRLGNEELMGLTRAVTERLNSDAAGFLTRHANEGSLEAILPAVGSAILNNASGQRAAIWEWLKTQRETETTKSLKKKVLSSAAFQDPDLALKMVQNLPANEEGDSQLRSFAEQLLNGGHHLHRFDKLFHHAPERLRPMLVEAAFSTLRAEALHDPELWRARLSQLPESARAKGTENFARAWAQTMPEEAIGWVASLPAGETRSGAAAAIASSWAKNDAESAAGWVASMPPGAERDRCARGLVATIAEKHPDAAWEWAVSIGDAAERNKAATDAARVMSLRNPSTVQEWIENGPFTPEDRSRIYAAIRPAADLQRAQ